EGRETHAFAANALSAPAKGVCGESMRGRRARGVASGLLSPNLVRVRVHRHGVAIGAQVGHGMAQLATCWRLTRQFGVPVVTAAVVATAVGTGAYFAGPYVGAAAAWLGGFVCTLAVQAALAIRKWSAMTGNTGFDAE